MKSYPLKDENMVKRRMLATRNKLMLVLVVILFAAPSIVSAQCVPATKNLTGGGTVCQGNTINLLLSSVEFDVNYSLKRDGVAVPGSTQTRGGTANLSWAVGTGGTYTAVAQKDGCSQEYAMSGESVVVITPIGSLTVTPSANPAAICYGTTFTLTASGGSGYQWHSNISMDYPTNMSWITPDINGTYWVTANVACAGNVESTHFTLNFLNPINGGSIGGAGQTICPGSTAATLTNATGASGSTGTYNYQWRSRPPAGTWADISGQTSATLAPGVVNSTTEYLRRASTTGCGDYHDSNVIIITTYSTVTPGIIGTNQTICSGSVPATLTNNTSPTLGNGTYAYQWQTSVNNTDWADIPGATSSTYTPPALTTQTYYKRRVTSCSITVSSASVTIGIFSTVTPGTIGSNQFICYSTAAATLTNQSSPANGNGTYTYQWQSSANGSSGWTDIPGATSSTYSPGTLTATTYYHRNATSCSVTVSSSSVMITVYPIFNPGGIGTAQFICHNTAPAALTNSSSASGGNGTITYQWQSSANGSSGWTDIAGATSTTYSPGTLTATIYYHRNATNTCGTVSSSSVMITVYPAFNPGGIGTAQFICHNTAPAALTSSSSASGGNGTITYQWQSSANGTSGWTDIAGATSTTYSPGALTATIYYHRNATNTCGTVSSSSVMITVYPALNSGGIGNAQSICNNTAPATLTSSSSASGGNGTITYQWQSSANGTSGWTDIAGATSTTYSPGALTATTYYRRNATNTCGTVSTSNVTVTVYPVFNPGGIGTAQFICHNTAPAALTSSSSASGGNGTITYQWQSSANGTSGWTDIAGATSATYSPGTLTATTYYHRNATNTCSPVSTASVMITVYPVFSPGGIGTAQFICNNTAPATLTSSSSASGGNGTITYQWQSSANGTSGWTDIAGATSTTYSPGTLTSTIYYHRNAANTCGTVSTSSVMITVYPVFNPGGIGTNQSICNNTAPATLTSSSSASGGNGTITYQWQSSANGTSGWTDIAGATSTTYSPGALTATTYYHRNATNTCGPVSTSSVMITVYPAFNPGGIGTAQFICHNTAPAALTSSSSASGGNGTITYQWQSSANGTSGWTDIAGATSTTYSPGALTATIYYHRNATNTCGTVSSSSVMITVYPALNSGGIGNAQSICNNTAPATLTSSSSASGGNGTITYQWQSSANGTSGWTDIAGATSTTYSPGALTATIYYHRNATNTCGTVSTSSVMVTVYPAFNPGGIGTAQSICNNTAPATLTSSSSASGGNGTITYQWQSSANGTSGWTNIAGATSTTYSPGALTATTYYHRNATNTCGPVSTSSVMITVYPALSPGGVGTNQSICNNTAPATLTSSSSASGGNGTITYQWQSSANGSTGWADIASATSTTYSPGALTTATYYRRNATNTCGTVSASSVTISINATVTPGAIGSNQTICTGGTPAGLTNVTSPTNGSGSYTYQWQSSPEGTNWTNISSATSITYAPGTVSSQTYYRRNVTSCSVTVSTTSIAISMYSTVTPGAIGSAQEICSGGTPATLTNTTSAAGGNGSIAYQWQSSPNGTSGWTNISSATAATYSPPTLTTPTYYRRNATSCSVTVSTSSVNVQVYAVPVITNTGSSTFVPGGSTVLTTAAGMDSYQWVKDGANITGATVNAFTAFQPGSYQVKRASAPECLSASVAITVQFDAPLQDMNYVQTVSFNKVGVTSTTNLNTLQGKEFVFATTYFDGLGRPLQTVALGAGGTGNDLIQINEYDAFGREAKKYLPYEHTSRDGRYQLNAGAAQVQFYNTMPDVAHDTKAYSNTDFETSPLNRPLKDYAPGLSWANKPVEHKYLINQDGTGAGQEKIIAWTINAYGDPVRLASLNCGYYPTGALTIKSTTDEDGHEVREYTDNSGRIILKKVYFTGSITDFSPGNWAETYYVYDEFGLLRFVFQPELSKSFSAQCTPPPPNPDPTSLSNFAFQYKYDSRKRMISKKVPGAEEVKMAYDDRDRLVLTQDGNLRAASKYLFTKYDALNRPIITGIYYAGGLDFSEVSGWISHTSFSESISTNVNDEHGYTNLLYPTSGVEILTVTYYDDYSFRSKWETDTGKDFDHVDADLSKDGIDFPSEESSLTNGLMTGTKVKVLDGGSTYLRTATYYDDRHRVIQTVAENYIGGTDRTSTLYDLAGKVLETEAKHVTTYSTHTILTEREFDGAGRLTATNHTTDGNNPVLLYANEYNSIGQLKAKSLHKEGTGNFSQRIDYGYNIRGWLTKINDGAANVNQSAGDYFGMELSYENPFSSLSATASYNGNISATKWAVIGIDDQAYAYEYDNMSRLKNATHYDLVAESWTDNGGRFSESVLNYDLNGNIKDLRRKGHTTASYMDDLHYDYIGTGNQLNFVNDLSGNAEGFANGTTGASVDYDYDDNGNLTQDLNKGIGAHGIAYNFLNLPQTVQKSATEYLMYTYDATGRKLRQQVFGSTAKVTDYVNEFVYEDHVLQFFNHEEGRVVKPGTPEYQYQMKDHLGNVRLTFTTVPDEEEATATLEDSNLNAEKAKFLRIENAKRIYSTLFDKTNGSSPGYSQRLSGSDFEKYGVARSIAVMPGDVVRAEVYAKYVDANNSGYWTQAMGTLMSQIAAYASGIVLIEGAYITSTTSFPYVSYQHTSGSGGPKAYLNWIVFDLNYNPILAKSGYDRISTSAEEQGQDVAHERLYSPDIVITEPGYVYIYLSNEEPTPVEVYFDDFKVTHEMGLLVQMNDYYPFGLTFNSIERDSPGNNRWKFQGQEHVDDLDLNWDSFKWRNHQPDIGRFFCVDPLANNFYYNSPYAFAENKLGLGVEFEGLELSRQRGVQLEVAQANNQLPKNLSINDRIDLQGGPGSYALNKVEEKLGTPTLAVSGNVQAGATSVQIVRNFQGLNVTLLAAEVASFEYKLQPGNESFRTGGIFDGEKKTVTSFGFASMGVFTEAGASITTSATGDQTLEYSLDGSLGGFGASTTGTTFPDGSTSETFRKGFTFSFGGGEGVSGNFKVFLGFETTRSTEVQSSQVKIE